MLLELKFSEITKFWTSMASKKFLVRFQTKLCIFKMFSWLRALKWYQIYCANVTSNKIYADNQKTATWRTLSISVLYMSYNVNSFFVVSMGKMSWEKSGPISMKVFWFFCVLGRKKLFCGKFYYRNHAQIQIVWFGFVHNFCSKIYHKKVFFDLGT